MSGPAAPDRDLDPDDWDGFRRHAHAALDAMIDHLSGLRERPVWTEAPPAVRQRFATPLPREGQDFGAVLHDFNANIRPYATGNLHPAFMGWVHGAGTPVGMVAEMLAAGLNANCGGRNHIGLVVEEQITRWMREAFGFPDTASGVFVTGTSMANFLACLVARTPVCGTDVRRSGLRGRPQLCAYASAAAHGCIAQALELAGIGSESLRRIPTGPDGGLLVGALEDAIAADRRAGCAPFLVVGTAGTVDTGAVDPLPALADLCEAEKLWFHVDGAFGALAVFSPDLAPLVEGLERARSIAFDFHKWAHVPYDAGFLLVRDGEAHRRTFASDNAYLTRAATGLAAGETWPCDLGPDLSRGFRALKTWFTLQVFGTAQLGAMMEKNCRLARQMAGLVEASDAFHLAAPVTLNIVCLSARGPEADRINRAIVEHLHTIGAAAPSITRLGGRAVIRCAINNHRTQAADIAAVMDALTEAYRAVAAD